MADGSETVWRNALTAKGKDWVLAELRRRPGLPGDAVYDIVFGFLADQGILPAMVCRRGKPTGSLFLGKGGGANFPDPDDSLFRRSSDELE